MLLYCTFKMVNFVMFFNQNKKRKTKSTESKNKIKSNKLKRKKINVNFWFELGHIKSFEVIILTLIKRRKVEKLKTFLVLFLDLSET